MFPVRFENWNLCWEPASQQASSNVAPPLTDYKQEKNSEKQKGTTENRWSSAPFIIQPGLDKSSNMQNGHPPASSLSAVVCGVINHFSVLRREREYQNVILNRKQKYFDIFTERPGINAKDMWEKYRAGSQFCLWKFPTLIGSHNCSCYDRIDNIGNIYYEYWLPLRCRQHSIISSPGFPCTLL